MTTTATITQTQVVVVPETNINLVATNDTQIQVITVGTQGPQGIPGVGVPAGGTAGQVLAKVDGTDYHTQWSNAGSGSGTVQSVSIVTANGFAGTVATSTTTPAITLTTSISGILKGNGTSLTAAAYSDLPSPTAGSITNSMLANAAVGNLSGTNTGDQTTITGNAGTATKWQTARTLAGNSVDGSANVAFSNKFIAQGTTDAGLSAAQFLGSLATGIVKNTTSTGVLSIAAYPDLPAPTAGSITNTMLANSAVANLSGTNTGDQTNITGNAGTVTTISGMITAGTNITITGSGTSGSPYNITASSSAGSAFNTITGGTNTTAAMVVGTGASLAASGSGTITATSAPASGITGTTLASGVTASSLTSVGTVTSGTWSGSFGAISGSNLTSLTAGNVTGTLPSSTLGLTELSMAMPTVANTTGNNIALDAKATFGYTINQIRGLTTSSGTCTAAIQINGTNVTGLGSLSVTSTPQDVNATAANNVSAGDRVSLVITSNSSGANLEFSLKATRT